MCSGGPLYAVLGVHRELRPQELRGCNAANESKSQEPIVCHAQTHVSALQEPLHWIGFSSFRLEVVLRLRLFAVLAGIAAALVGTTEEVEEHDIDGAWAECS